MQNVNVKLNFGTTLGLLFFTTIFLAIIFRDSVFTFITDLSGTTQIQESQAAAKETADLLLSLDKINLDTSVLNSYYLQSLVAIPNFPIDSQTLTNFGKANPFLGNFVIVPASASTTVGGVVYSNQRGANEGQSLTPVSPTRR